MNRFPFYLLWHCSLHNFPHHHLILLLETYSPAPGDVINTLRGCRPALRDVQNCWAVMRYRRLIFLMPLGIIPALTIYKTPTAARYVKRRLHFTAWQNRPFWDHFSFLVSGRIQYWDPWSLAKCKRAVVVFFLNDFFILRICLGTECSTETNRQPNICFYVGSFYRPPFHLPMVM